MSMTSTEDTSEFQNALGNGNSNRQFVDRHGSRRVEDSEPESFTRILDRFIPLHNASHADVSAYIVETPMRYSECFATLDNGAKVGLMNRRQFVGSKNSRSDQSLLFSGLGMLIEVCTGQRGSESAESTGGIQSIAIRLSRDTASTSNDGDAPQYVAIDGSLIVC